MHISKAKSAIVLGVVAITAAGCAGRVETRKLSDQAMSDTDKKITGIIVYQPALFAEMSVKTTYVVNGKPAGSSKDNPPACTPVPSERTVALPDLKNPYVVTYNPGLFDSNTFGVTIQSGMLAGVNSNSTAAQNNGATANTPLGAIPIPTPLGIPLSAPAPADNGGIMTPVFERIASTRITRPGIATSRVASTGPDLPGCNDGPMILGYRRLPLP